MRHQDRKTAAPLRLLSSCLGLRTWYLLAVLLLLSAPTIPAGQASTVPTSTIRLFDGTLNQFETWLVDQHSSDPQHVFSVVNNIDGAPALRITGHTWGGLLTKQAYRNYRLVAEFRWGGTTWGDRTTRARDSGILLHAQGRPGNTGKDFNGPWLRSIEFQIIEGGVGDILPVLGYLEDGTVVRPSVNALTRKDRDGETVFDPRGTLSTYAGGRINWWGRSEDWDDKVGFRGTQDVETPNLGWNRVEAVVDGANLTYYVNGTLVNAATESTVTDGKIMIQSEGAEILFRRFELQPLGR